MPSGARTLRHLNEDYDDDNSNDDDDDDDGSGGGGGDDDDDDDTGPFGFFKLLLKYVFLNVNTVHGNRQRNLET